MARRDYSDDDDFYEQDFEKKGVLSVWVSIDTRSEDKDVDTLQDLCGIGFYQLSAQESNHLDYQLIGLASLLADLSYSKTYMNDVVSAAREKGIEKARWVVVQYDFAYDPAAVTRTVEADPIFLGIFEYSDK
ncbi:MAG: immunity 22 family protein [Telluria sp.]